MGISEIGKHPTTRCKRSAKNRSFCRLTILRRSNLGQRLAGWVTEVRHTKKKHMEAKIVMIRFRALGTTLSSRANSRSQTFAGAASESREERPNTTVVIASEGSFFTRATDQRYKLVAGTCFVSPGLTRIYLAPRPAGELQRARRKGESALRHSRAEVHAVQKRNAEWWVCTDRSCGQKIQFVMLDGTPGRINPACFCGSRMKYCYVKPQFARYENILPTRDGTPGTAKVTVQLFVLPLEAMTRLLPGPEA
jgi:hypothetical protein